MRKWVPTLALLVLFTFSLGLGLFTADIAAADDPGGPDCWAYCKGGDLIQCCDFPQHGVLCSVKGPCPF